MKKLRNFYEIAEAEIIEILRNLRLIPPKSQRRFSKSPAAQVSTTTDKAVCSVNTKIPKF